MESVVTVGILIGGLAVLALVAWGGVWLTQWSWRAANTQQEHLKAIKAFEHDRVNWRQTPERVWARMYHAVPELAPAAAARLLGQGYLDHLAEAVMRAHPVTDITGESSVGVSAEQAPNLQKDHGIPFKEGEPQQLMDYDGQPAITAYLQALIDGLPDTEPLPRAQHQLFFGVPGMGKTLLNKVFVNTLNQRNARLGLPAVAFQEEFPADLATLQALDAAVRRAMEQPTALFIDEIHDLTDRHALKLYMLMEDGRYKFEDEPAPVDVPYILLLGATTDADLMHPALKRRFNRHELQPMPRERIVDIVRQRAYPVSAAAAELIVSRTHYAGAPWEALQLYGQAVVFAKAARQAEVGVADVERVFELQDIDTHGLRAADRRVIAALFSQPRYRRAKGGGQEFVCYGASEADVCAMARVNKGEYRDTIKPRLLARRLLQVRATYGQALLPRALEWYPQLKPA